MKELDPRPKEKQPFFGANAKPFFIQMALVLFCVLVIVPFARPYFEPSIRAGVESLFNGACSSIGWCTPEAAARLNASEHQ